MLATLHTAMAIRVLSFAFRIVANTSRFFFFLLDGAQTAGIATLSIFKHWQATRLTWCAMEVCCLQLFFFSGFF
jgi:hypothetical protein